MSLKDFLHGPNNYLCAVLHLCICFLVYLCNFLCKDFFKEIAAWSWKCIISLRFCKLAFWEVKTRLARCPAVHHVLSGATGSIEPVSTQLSFLASGGGGGVENLISGHFYSSDKGSPFLKCSPFDSPPSIKRAPLDTFSYPNFSLLMVAITSELKILGHGPYTRTTFQKGASLSKL